MKKTMLSVMLGAGLVTLSVNAAVTGKLLLEFAAMGPPGFDMVVPISPKIGLEIS